MLNLDFTQTVFIRTAKMAWSPSPMAGVERKKLSRAGDEQGHATSLVRYAPQSYFKPHTHPGGEEILVLEGVFSDEHLHYPAGTYFRNPPGTSHQPYSDAGCLLLVKLHQFDFNDSAQFHHSSLFSAFSNSTNDTDDEIIPANSIVLHEHSSETVLMHYLATGDILPQQNIKGLSAQQNHLFGQEWFVIAGELSQGNHLYQRHDWLRSPTPFQTDVLATRPSIVWQKINHLNV